MKIPPLITIKPKPDRPLGQRIILHTIVFSSLITLIISIVQLSNEFSDRQSAVKQELDGVHVLLPSIAESVWTFNDAQIALALRALTSMPHFEEATILTPEGGRWTSGRQQSTRFMQRTYLLERHGRTGPQALGTLEITAGIDAVYVAVFTMTAGILFGNAIKTFLVAGFMGWLIHVLVTSRLAPLKREIEAVLDDSGQPSVPDAAGDELEALKESFTRMATRLNEAVGSMRTAKAALHSANADLDARVKEKTAELERSKENAEEATAAVLRSMGEQRNFLSMVSHEFRGPLSAIGGAAQIIAIYGQGNGELAEEVAKINRAVARMVGLIDEYLNEERLDSTTSPPEVRRFDLGELVHEACSSGMFSTGLRPINVLAESELFVSGDSNLIAIAVANIVDNAMKYSPAGSPVTVTARRQPQGAEVAVRDWGPGIPASERDKIFEKYYRSVRTDRVCGVGLGLYLVKRIVDMHGGAITVESCPADGTVFTVQLPLVAEG
ncbi:Putative signal transduction histidine kinase [Magnetospirillum sp. XM-1]|uniref:ATP-binding protein n=1 Tax=Magnetospirillum sp. XM-1 TaxID=1663591 RepID=UPI00073DE852|nr:ATP-binding protein [Magnetospirillum sp. XM-1]CUW40002.1 Putative signal transduction histidine kinase [Magnetospirillum sp. XM-1]